MLVILICSLTEATNKFDVAECSLSDIILSSLFLVELFVFIPRHSRNDYIKLTAAEAHLWSSGHKNMPGIYSRIIITQISSTK